MVEPRVKILVGGVVGNGYAFEVFGGSVPVDAVPVRDRVGGDGEGEEYA